MILSPTMSEENNNELLYLLDLEDVDKGVFLGPPSRAPAERVFGGQVMAQALAAASFTVDEWVCHSLHGYFVRPSKPARPIQYEVSAFRDGRSFCTRQVVAVQRDEVNFQLVASFQRADGGFEHQTPMPEVPQPGDLEPLEQRLQKSGDKLPEGYAERVRKMPIEMLPVEAFALAAESPAPATPRRHVWMRAKAPLPDDQNLHRCVLTYASDLGALSVCMLPLGIRIGDPQVEAASLDHALWFHRDFRADEWMLFQYDSPSVSDGRGLSRGAVFSHDGRLIASVAQEGMIRRRRTVAAT